MYSIPNQACHVKVIIITLVNGPHIAHDFAIIITITNTPQFPLYFELSYKNNILTTLYVTWRVLRQFGTVLT